ncbi:MAG: trigger factor [Firmicutes bacterium]|jgi:trigger factor|nr:trigger factor [Bacillota bacterium]
MKTTMEKLEKSRVRLTVDIDADTLEEAIEGAYRRVVRQVNIPGFRKGKAPRKIIEMNYGIGVFLEDAIDILLPKVYQHALEETEIRPVDQPDLDVERMEPGEGATFVFEVDVYPEIELGTYKGLEAEKEIVEITDEDVMNILKQQQERSAELIVVDSREDVQEGDFAIIDFAGFVDGEPFSGGAAEDHMLEIGSGQFIPGFEEQLIGTNVGETKDIAVTFPEDYHAEHLAGKEATFKVTVKELKEKLLPELDDEFAKDISDKETLDELKALIRKNLEDDATRRTAAKLENILLQQIAESSQVEIPQSMIEHQAEHLVQNFFQSMMYQGIDEERYLELTGMTKEELRSEFEPQALTQITNDLILAAVAEKEGITISDEELSSKIDEYVAESSYSEEETRKYWESQKHNLKISLEREKTMNFIVEQSKITEVAAGESSQEEADAAD